MCLLYIPTVLVGAQYECNRGPNKCCFSKVESNLEFLPADCEGKDKWLKKKVLWLWNELNVQKISIIGVV